MIFLKIKIKFSRNHQHYFIALIRSINNYQRLKWKIEIKSLQLLIKLHLCLSKTNNNQNIILINPKDKINTIFFAIIL